MGCVGCNVGPISSAHEHGSNMSVGGDDDRQSPIGAHGCRGEVGPVGCTGVVAPHRRPTTSDEARSNVAALLAHRLTLAHDAASTRRALVEAEAAQERLRKRERHRRR